MAAALGAVLARRGYAPLATATTGKRLSDDWDELGAEQALQP
jgi:hypothetical protein